MRIRTVKPNTEIIEQIMQLEHKERIATLVHLYKRMSADELRENYITALCHFEAAEKKLKKQGCSYIEQADTKHNGFRVVKYS